MAHGEPVSSSQQLKPGTLRKSKASSSSPSSSIVDEVSSEGPGSMRSSNEAALNRTNPKSTGDQKRLKSFLSKAKSKKFRRSKEKLKDTEDEARRGGSVAGRSATKGSDGVGAGRSGSGGSRDSQHSETSQLTFDSEGDPTTSTAPPLVSRESHTGYLTLSSPLMKERSAIETEPALNSSMSDIGNGPVHTQGLPSKALHPLSSSVTSDSSPRLYSSPRHAATSPASGLGPKSDGKVNSVASPVVGKFREVFSSTASTSKQDSRNVSASSDWDASVAGSANNSLNGLFGPNNEEGGLFSNNRTGTIASRRLSRGIESVPSAIQTSGMTGPVRDTGKIGIIPATPPGRAITPVTTVTPPTPTLPAGASPSLVSPASEENFVGPSPTGSSSAHRRMRSNSSSKGPSGLSNSVSAPLTPTMEEPRSLTGTSASGERAGNQAGFFSNVLSAAQNAATTLGNSISNNPLVPGGRDRAISGAIETVSVDGAKAKNASGGTRPLTAENLGKVQAATGSIPRMGMTLVSGSAPVLTSASISADRVPAGGYLTEVERFSRAAKTENGSIRTVSSTTGTDDGARYFGRGSGKRTVVGVGSATEERLNGEIVTLTPTPTRTEDAFTPMLRHAATDSIITGDGTPPGSRDLERDSVFRRSGSVRSRTNTSIRRKRGSSAATSGGIGAAIINASNAALAHPGLNTSVPRLTGFAVASTKRNRDFHQAFRTVPEDDYLIEDYSAAFQKDILLHGRFYVSEGHLCFSSNIFGYVTTLVISFDEVLAIEKRNTAIIIPNGLVVQTARAKHVFASFTSRDSTYDLLIGIWKISHPHLRSFANGVAVDGIGGGDRTEQYEEVGPPISEEESESWSGDEKQEMYDEDDEEDEKVGSLHDATEGSPADEDGIGSGSVGNGNGSGDLLGRGHQRKASALPLAVATAQCEWRSHGESGRVGESGEMANGSPSTVADFPGPPGHAPTECSDGETHYEKVIKDEVVAAPLGKVYSLLFGPQSGVFMVRWLTDEQRVLELTMEDDKKGLGEGQKQRTFSYIKPLSGAIGPKQTKCVITEVLDAMSLERAVSVTITTQTPDVPSGNAFSTKTKYCLTWAEGNTTRMLISCAIEWTGKSWLKGPIEKGANDGQIAYANDIATALKAAVSSASKARTGMGTSSRSGKIKRRKKDTSTTLSTPSRSPTSTSTSSVAGSSWGPLRPLHPYLSPITDLVSPLFTNQVIIISLSLLLTINWWRSSRVTTAQSSIQPGSRALFTIPTAERIAAYEQMWQAEENTLWDWLEERVGDLPALQKPSHDEGHLPRASHEQVRSASDKHRREMEEAVRITEVQLDELKRGLQRESDREECRVARDEGRTEGSLVESQAS